MLVNGFVMNELDGLLLVVSGFDMGMFMCVL